MNSEALAKFLKKNTEAKEEAVNVDEPSFVTLFNFFTEHKEIIERVHDLWEFSQNLYTKDAMREAAVRMNMLESACDYLFEEATDPVGCPIVKMVQIIEDAVKVCANDYVNPTVPIIALIKEAHEDTVDFIDHLYSTVESSIDAVRKHLETNTRGNTFLIDLSLKVHKQLPEVLCALCTLFGYSAETTKEVLSIFDTSDFIMWLECYLPR